MKDNLPSYIALLACISLFGLVVYKVMNPNLTIEEKKNISYAQIGLSFFASFMLLFYMGFLLMGLSFFLSLRKLLENPHALNILQLFTWAIFSILISPFSLTLVQYGVQDKLGKNDKFLSITILISTLYSAIFPLRMIAPFLFK
jgi:hypothetical protein